jgi:predicted GIY-YIG superfamily endonuclease
MSKRHVYVIRNDAIPPRYYTGVTSDVARRRAEHNAGRCSHTAKYGPWSIDVVIEFADERRAVAFERYLKSGSGVAFAQRHLRWFPTFQIAIEDHQTRDCRARCLSPSKVFHDREGQTLTVWLRRSTRPASISPQASVPTEVKGVAVRPERDWPDESLAEQLPICRDVPGEKHPPRVEFLSDGSLDASSVESRRLPPAHLRQSPRAGRLAGFAGHGVP